MHTVDSADLCTRKQDQGPKNVYALDQDGIDLFLLPKLDTSKNKNKNSERQKENKYKKILKGRVKKEGKLRTSELKE